MAIKPFKPILSKAQKERVVAAIRQAEKNTSGEIRVHLEKRCSGNPLERAARVFNKLGMEKTALRNGILLYIATHSRRCAVYADQGIFEKVDPQAWEGVLETLLPGLKKAEIELGIETAVFRIGEILRQFFPHQSDDKNELSDDISES
ncbi:MAG: TPM domain-containing protein [Calditrichaeota bacterium]|nr:TPM domain-containing protein [Calditrichota bacterium]